MPTKLCLFTPLNIITCFTHENMRLERGKIHRLNLQEKRLAGERQSLANNDMHLTWNLCNHNQSILTDQRNDNNMI